MEVDLTNPRHFTDRLLRVTRLAAEISHHAGRPSVDADDLLMALLSTDRGVGLAAVELCGVDPQRLLPAKARAEPHRSVREHDPVDASGQYDQVLQHAAAEARGMNHRYLGTEHLVLGLMAVLGTAAQRAMSREGLALDGLRARVVEMVGLGIKPPTEGDG